MRARSLALALLVRLSGSTLRGGWVSYRRIIYGPEYDAPDNLVRLRELGLAGKRNLALREFAVDHESLDGFVAKEPLRRVHERVFAVWALESKRSIHAFRSTMSGRSKRRCCGLALRISIRFWRKPAILGPRRKRGRSAVTLN